MPVQVFTQTMACNVTQASTAVWFPTSARNVTVYIPSAASGADVRFLTSYDGGTTFVGLSYPPTSGTVAVGRVQVGSAITNACVKISELAGQQYVKAEYTTLVVNSTGTFRYIVEY